MMEPEGVETMELAEAMAGVILVTGMSMKTGVAVGEDFLTVEVMDTGGLIRWGAPVVASTALAG